MSKIEEKIQLPVVIKLLNTGHNNTKKPIPLLAPNILDQIDPKLANNPPYSLVLLKASVPNVDGFLHVKELGGIEGLDQLAAFLDDLGVLVGFEYYLDEVLGEDPAAKLLLGEDGFGGLGGRVGVG